jgi:hypothetical protein
MRHWQRGHRRAIRLRAVALVALHRSRLDRDGPLRHAVAGCAGRGDVIAPFDPVEEGHPEWQFAPSRAVARSTIPSSLDPLRHVRFFCHVRTVASSGHAADLSRHLYVVHVPAVRRQRPFDRDRRNEVTPTDPGRPMGATYECPRTCDWDCTIRLFDPHWRSSRRRVQGRTGHPDEHLGAPRGAAYEGSEHATRLRNPTTPLRSQ